MSKVPDAIRKELASLAAKPESKIDFSDLPATAPKDWRTAEQGQFYRPLKRQLTVRIDADVLGENGESLANGKVGELAIRKTWIGMAQGFWNEPERYLETYWQRFENIWVHGDLAYRLSVLK